MKMILKLLLIYIGFQFVGSLLAAPFLFFADKTTMLSVGLIISSVLMIGYLWKRDYLKIEKSTWSMGPKYTLLWLIPYALGGYLFATYVNEVLHLPNLMEDQFVDMSSSVVGVLCIVLIGPIAEEFLFRGVMMNYFLREKGYNGKTAIFLSALIFGIIHFNPAQIVYAFLLGMIIGRIYFQIGSLLLCCIVHVVLNGISTFLTICYPGVENMKDMFGSELYPWFLPAAMILMFSSSIYMKKLKSPLWEVQPNEEPEYGIGTVINEESKQ